MQTANVLSEEENHNINSPKETSDEPIVASEIRASVVSKNVVELNSINATTKEIQGMQLRLNPLQSIIVTCVNLLITSFVLQYQPKSIRSDITSYENSSIDFNKDTCN